MKTSQRNYMKRAPKMFTTQGNDNCEQHVTLLKQ